MNETVLIVLLSASFLILLMVLAQSAIKPLKWIWMIALNVVVGALGLYFINLIGGLFQFHLPINPVTAVVTGMLGVPGVVCLALVKLLLLT